jgi:hypothetical protein
MRNGASVSQLLQVSVLPRGARIVRVVSMRLPRMRSLSVGVKVFIAVSGVREWRNYRAALFDAAMAEAARKCLTVEIQPRIALTGIECIHCMHESIHHR